MKNRIKKLRDELGKSQEDLAKDLGLSRNYISLVENGQRNLSEQSQRVLCSLYSVNQNWLRDGTGEMFIPISKSDQIADMISDVLKSNEEDFKRRLISALAQLDDSGWENLEKLIDMISGKN